MPGISVSDTRLDLPVDPILFENLQSNEVPTFVLRPAVVKNRMLGKRKEIKNEVNINQIKGDVS